MTNFYGDAGEFDRRCGINLGIWSQWFVYSLSFMRVKEVGLEHSVQGSCRTIVQVVSCSPKEGDTVINA